VVFDMWGYRGRGIDNTRGFLHKHWRDAIGLIDNTIECVVTSRTREKRYATHEPNHYYKIEYYLGSAEKIENSDPAEQPIKE